MIQQKRTSVFAKSTIISLLLCSSTVLVAREIRTPLSFLWWWTRYPLERPTDCQDSWYLDVKGGAYHRESDVTFLDKNTSKKQPLAGIYFNKPTFTLAETFPDGEVPESLLAVNPCIQYAAISPRFTYKDNGAFVGCTLEYPMCNSCWNVGVRGVIPFKRIEVQLDNCCQLAEVLDDVCATRRDQLEGAPSAIQESYAYRLDFLSALRLSTGDRMVEYGDGDEPTTVAAVNVTDTNDNSGFPIHAVRSTSGLPTQPFSRRQEVVDSPAVTNLPASGVLGANGDRGKFIATTDYATAGLGTDPATQRTLYVVPTANNAGTDLVPDARVIQSAIQNVLGQCSFDVVKFLEGQGITFETQRLVGLGDLETQFFANYAKDCFYGEVFFGLKLPTGRREKNPGQLLAILTPRGNNRHFEVQVAGLLGHEVNDWLKLKVDGMYSYVIRRNEKVAASFSGATVKNINPTVNADVSWHYFVVDADATFVHPRACGVGFDAGYQGYIKLRDRVRFKRDQGPDLAGVEHDLDPENIERRTKVVAHKARVEGFFEGDFYRLYGGWNTVYAGKNSPRETDLYLGLGIYF